MDIEVAAGLTNKSRTNLAKAKSKRINPYPYNRSHYLGQIEGGYKGFLKAETLQCWYPHLYIVLHGNPAMRSESLAAYIHWFKREARRCNFTNNTGTIRIFIKGLKNTHGLATCIYEKRLQTLADTIYTVERLQTVQHLTATLILPTMFNVMSQEEDHCFWCQEQGHIACHCPNVRCCECDEYSHVVVDCPHRIPPSGTPANHQQPRSYSRHHTQSSSQHHHEDRHQHRWSRSHTHSIIIEAQSITTHTETTLDHTIGSTEDMTGAAMMPKLIHLQT